MPARGNEKPHAENAGSGACSSSGPRPCRAWPTWPPSTSTCGNAAAAEAEPHGGRLQGVDRAAFRRRPGQGPAVAGASRSTPASSSRRRWTSIRRCSSTATATACRGTHAFRAVTVKGYIDRVEVVDGRPGGGAARTQLRPRRADPRPAALSGDPGAAAGSAGPRSGAAQLAVAGIVRAACGKPWSAAWSDGWTAAIHPRAAVAGRTPAGECSRRSKPARTQRSGTPNASCAEVQRLADKDGSATPGTRWITIRCPGQTWDGSTNFSSKEKKQMANDKNMLVAAPI